MRRVATLSRFSLLCAGCVWLAGCSAGSRSDDEDIEEAGVAELTDDAGPSAARAPAPASPVPTSSPAQPVVSPLLRNEWPLVKTVVQHLRQQTPEGETDSRSTLELAMTIAPDGPRGGQHAGNPQEAPLDGVLYRVHFQRIRYSQEAPGQAALTYDSDLATNVVPLALYPYQGMKSNGFQFKLDGRLQLTHVVGFEEFLERCLRELAPEQRASVRSSLPVSAPAEGVAHFVDETIGLVPPDVGQAGDNWMRSRMIAQPLPCVVATRYTIRQMTSEAAEIDVAGTINALPDTVSPNGAASSGVQVAIRGGQLLGQCRIDRRSGLPVRSRVEQSLEMTVRIADGAEFLQRKTTLTVLELRSAERPAGPESFSPGTRGQSPQLSTQSPASSPGAASIRR